MNPFPFPTTTNCDQIILLIGSSIKHINIYMESRFRIENKRRYRVIGKNRETWTRFDPKQYTGAYVPMIDAS